MKEKANPRRACAFNNPWCSRNKSICNLFKICSTWLAMRVKCSKLLLVTRIEFALKRVWLGSILSKPVLFATRDHTAALFLWLTKTLNIMLVNSAKICFFHGFVKSTTSPFTSLNYSRRINLITHVS